LYLMAGPLVQLALGSNWLAAVPVVKILAGLSLVRGMTFSLNSLFVAKHQQKYVAIITGVAMLGIGVLIIPLVVRGGLVGAAQAAGIGGTVALPVMIYLGIKVLRGL